MNETAKLRAVAKRAIREQISACALLRFQSTGFQDTTVDDIARDVGMSQRTFFRYFKSKDDVLLDSTYAFQARFLESFKANLPSGDLWNALTLALEASALDCFKPKADKKIREIQTLIRTTPALLAKQLETMDKFRFEIVRLCEAPSSPVSKLGTTKLQAIVGSTFACYHALYIHVAADSTLEAATYQLRDVMKALKPSALI